MGITVFDRGVKIGKTKRFSWMKFTFFLAENLLCTTFSHLVVFFFPFLAVREDRMPGGRNSGAVYNLYKVRRWHTAVQCLYYRDHTRHIASSTCGPVWTVFNRVTTCCYRSSIRRKGHRRTARWKLRSPSLAPPPVLWPPRWKRKTYKIMVRPYRHWSTGPY